jgi:hypothetical protein
MTVIRIAANNDNQWVKRFFRYRNEEHGDQLDAMRHIEQARHLIKTYSTKTYRHSTDDPDYVFLEFQICTILNLPSISPAQRTFMLNDLAWLLEVSPIKLMDEPSLSFNATDLARFP